MRTDTEIVSNKFDCDLARLLRKAESRAADRGDSRWLRIAEDLRAARVKVRCMMHNDDREETAG